MNGLNHKVGGLTFTATFASFADVNILSDWRYITATIFFSLLPDIDHTKSLIGKVFRPIAAYLNTNYGHRTITHSLLFYVATVSIVAALESLTKSQYSYTLTAALALGSHYIFDMCTKAGIPLLYPFSRRPCVLPGNPKLRLSTNDIKAEAGVFLIFCCLFFFNQSLFAEGFWTKYNRVFLDFEHIEREAKRHGDVINVVFSHEGKIYSANMVSTTQTQFLTMLGGQLKEIPKNEIKLLNFKHTGIKAKTEVINVFNVSADSLKNMLKNKHLLSATIQSEEEIQYFEGSVIKSGKVIQVKNTTDFHFNIIKAETGQTAYKIRMLLAEMAMSKRQNDLKRKEREVKLERIKQIDSIFNTSTDYEKGKLIEERKRRAQSINNFDSIAIVNLKHQIELDELNRVITNSDQKINANITTYSYQ